MWKVEQDVFRDRMLFIPGLKTVYMGGGMGCFRDTMLFIPSLQENVSTRDNFTRDNLQSQHNIVQAKRGGVFM